MTKAEIRLVNHRVTCVLRRMDESAKAMSRDYEHFKQWFYTNQAQIAKDYDDIQHYTATSPNRDDANTESTKNVLIRVTSSMQTYLIEVDKYEKSRACYAGEINRLSDPEYEHHEYALSAITAYCQELEDMDKCRLKYANKSLIELESFQDRVQNTLYRCQRYMFNLESSTLSPQTHLKDMKQQCEKNDVDWRKWRHYEEQCDKYEFSRP